MSVNNFDPKDKIIVVTGGAHGIGCGLAKEFHNQGAAHIIVADMDIDKAGEVAREIGGTAWQLDVSDEVATAEMIDAIERDIGPIDLYFSNAGILFTDAPDWNAYTQSTEQWQKIWEINVLAHVHACRALLPKMKARGHGAFMITASAAGLLSQIGDASYSTTKHAALGFAESLAITHSDDGIYVGVVCPQAVESNMTKGAEDSSAALDGILTASEFSKRTIQAMRAGQFMIRPHEQVVEYFKNKAENYDRWVGGMRKLRRMMMASNGRPV